MREGMNESIMNCEKTRFETFQSWPTNAEVEPQRIAKAGFFYTGIGLEVECFSCRGRISEWNYGDQVMSRHRQMNPECSFVKDPGGSGNIPVVNRSPSLYSQTSEPNQSVSLNGSDQTDGNLNVSQDSNHSTTSTSSSAYSTSTDPTSSSDTSDNSPNDPMETASTSSNTLNRNDVNSLFLYKSEAARLQSFSLWPRSAIVSPQLLAKAGFFYLQEEDRVQCAFCRGVVQNWEAGDDPVVEHRRHFPNCPLLYNLPVGNIPINGENQGDHSENISQSSFENIVVRDMRPFSAPDRDAHGSQSLRVLPMNELGIHSHRGPKYPKYSTIESRLRTYTNWPSGLTQTPQQLAQAGFFYTGANDQVRCFHCDGGLRQWDANDDPWIEHARWFSNCTYVVLVKGEEFIQQALTQHPPLLSSDNLQGNTSEPPRPRYQVREVTDEEIEGLMNMPSVRSVLEIGLDREKIKHVLRQNMEQTGLPYVHLDSFIEAVLDVSSDTNTPESPSASNAQATDSRSAQGDHSYAGRAPSLDGAQGRQTPLSSSKSLPNFSMEAGATEATIQRSDKSARSMPQLSQEKTAEGRELDPKKEFSLEEENRRLKEARLCKVCMDEEVGVVFVPCGHLVTCVNCTPSIEDCPMCRQPIKATVRTFLS